jgi:hypothetical protein
MEMRFFGRPLEKAERTSNLLLQKNLVLNSSKSLSKSIKHIDSISKNGSVYLDEDPFEKGYQEYPLLLKQDCCLIDGGGDYIDELRNLVGKTTAWEGTPDNNVADIGFHYFNWYYVNAGDSNGLNADLNQDDTVNFRDFAILADRWQTDYDINDLKILADEWLRVKPMPNVIPSFDGDPNNLNGYVELSIDVPDTRTYRTLLLLDGELYGEFYSADNFERPTIQLQTDHFANGPHSLKVVSLDYHLNVVCSESMQIIFNNQISGIAMDKSYKLGNPFYLYAYGTDNYTVEVLNRLGLKYSENFAGNIQAVIPSETFSDHTGLYEIGVKDSVGNRIYGDLFGEHFDAAAPASDPCVKILITVGSEVIMTGCQPIVDKIEDRGNVKFGSGSVKVLGYNDCTWENAKAAIVGYPNLKIWIHMSHGTIPVRPIPNITFLTFIRAVEFHGVYVSAFPNLREKYDFATDLPFWLTPKLNFVFFHCCYGAYDYQFSNALHITPLPPEEPRGRAFISWYKTGRYDDSFEQYTTYLVQFFEKMISDGESVLEAKDHINEGDVRGAHVISDNMTTLGLDEQYVHFDYPDINPPHSPP